MGPSSTVNPAEASRPQRTPWRSAARGQAPRATAFRPGNGIECGVTLAQTCRASISSRWTSRTSPSLIAPSARHPQPRGHFRPRPSTLRDRPSPDRSPRRAERQCEIRPRPGAGSDRARCDTPWRARPTAGDCARRSLVTTMSDAGVVRARSSAGRAAAASLREATRSRNTPSTGDDSTRYSRRTRREAASGLICGNGAA